MLLHHWLLALHVISIVCWFAGLFYLPRLFVYHAKTDNQAVAEQFKIMEHRLYYYIMMPSMFLTVFFGACLWLPHYDYYAHMNWLHIKLILVLTLVIYHFYCGTLVTHFKYNKNIHSHKFYRLLNEYPTLVLLIVVILSFVKP